jgi:hypothetical protein
MRSALLTMLVSASAASAQCGLTWQVASLAPIPEGGDQFGRAVAVGGTRVVSNAWRANQNNGGAHVFRWENGSLAFDGSLVPPNAAQGLMCGTEVALDSTGSIAVLSSLGDDTMGINAGAAYVYRCTESGWVHETSLFAPDAMESDAFGASVAVEGDTIVIGATGVDSPPSYWSGGAIYVYRFANGAWGFESRLLPPDLDIGDAFGAQITIDGDRFAVGVPNKDNEFGDNAGAVYVYADTPSGWALESRVVPDDLGFGNAFGLSVALDGQTLLVASAGETGVDMSGVVYRFDRHPLSGVWRQHARFTAPRVTPFDFFGETMDAENGRVLISSRTADAQGTSVHVFELTPSATLHRQSIVGATASPFVFANSAVAIGRDFAIVGEALHGANMDGTPSRIDIYEVCDQPRGKVMSGARRLNRR